MEQVVSGSPTAWVGSNAADPGPGRVENLCFDVSCTHAGETPPGLVLRWGAETLQHLLTIHFSSEAGLAGTALTSSYQLWDVSSLHAAHAHHMLQLIWHCY